MRPRAPAYARIAVSTPYGRWRDSDRRRLLQRDFLDLAGELWQKGALVDKVATAFTSSQTEHGGQESTILALNNTLYHWGAIVLPLGYTVHEVFNGGGNPYGASFTSDHQTTGPDENTLVVARAQGARLTRVARAIRVAREAGLLTATAAAKASSSTERE